ncbi:DUF2570 family protein [Intestinirhabdus alba]|jgi:predicted transcriptional regulator|uniref:DUF2570 domain-containing protein n=1 Tax=Intestinirhabdus alba TaxID=2899544 RepID=A0A6L6IRV7_9ENTR|nr:DUF2570 family protein [Intestinirhabdus alba]MTH48116.1 DUF2570 domain-containing protein [Intestinirhabdus alba]
MILKVFKLAGVLSLLVVIAAGWQWNKLQQERLSALQEANIRLGQKLEIQQAHLNDLMARKANLEAALIARQQKQYRLEKTYEQYRQQLGQAVEQAPCAGQPVPDDVIRLQRDALSTDIGAR